MGGGERGIPSTSFMGMTLKNVAAQKAVMARELQPDLVTISRRCGPWSQMQRINPNVDKVRERVCFHVEDRKEDIPLWRFCRQVWDEQDKNGRLGLTANSYRLPLCKGTS